MRLMYLMATALGVTTVSLFITFAGRFNLKVAEASVWGQLGDFVGGLVNPWVGLFTVFLLLSTLRLQQQELSEQRAETVRQNDILTLQSFEQSFFSWLNSYGEMLRGLEYSYRGPDDDEETERGPAELSRGLPVLRHHLNAVLHVPGYKDKPDAYAALRTSNFHELSNDELSAACMAVLNQWSARCRLQADDVGAASRTLYALIRWVHTSPTLKESAQRAHYMDIIRARMTLQERRAMMIDCLLKENRDDLVKIGVEYEFLTDKVARGRSALRALWTAILKIEAKRSAGKALPSSL